MLTPTISYRNFDYQAVVSAVQSKGSATIELGRLRGALLQAFLVRFEVVRNMSDAKRSREDRRIGNALIFSGLSIFLGLFFPKLMSIAEFVMDTRAEVEVVRSDKTLVVITGTQHGPGDITSH